MNQTELLALIQQAKAEAWTELDLRGQDLGELPLEITELRQLEILRLGYLENPFRSNYLTQLPDLMAQLTNLHTLDISDNSLNQLPSTHQPPHSRHQR